MVSLSCSSPSPLHLLKPETTSDLVVSTYGEMYEIQLNGLFSTAALEIIYRKMELGWKAGK